MDLSVLLACLCGAIASSIIIEDKAIAQWLKKAQHAGRCSIARECYSLKTLYFSLVNWWLAMLVIGLGWYGSLK